MKSVPAVAILFMMSYIAGSLSQLSLIHASNRSAATPIRASDPWISSPARTPSILVSSDLFPGSDVGARISAAQSSLHGRQGIISVNRAGVLSHPVSLAAGNELRLAAKLTLSAPITLSGNNTITCTLGGSVTTGMDAFTGTKGADNLALRGCSVRGTNVNAVFFNTSGSHIAVENNRADGIALLRADGGDDVRVDSNTMTGTAQNFNPVVWGGNVTNASFTHNDCNTVGWCFTFFNADANSSKINSRSAVAAFGGHYIISGNHCINVNACYWGSVGHDVTMTGNYAENCSDVCYDVEGCMDVNISGNQGVNGTNGVGATFFFADHVTFDRNDFRNPDGHGIIYVHNVTQAPSNNQYLTVTNNTLTCVSAICPAVGGDPAGNVSIANNTIYDGTVAFGLNIGSAEIQHNTFKFLIVSPKPFEAISNGLLINSAVYTIEDNTFTAPAQPAGSICILVNAGDYNTSAKVAVLRNDIAGFPIDIATNNGGGNVGTRVEWTVSANHARSGVIQHTHKGSDGDSYSDADNILGTP